MRSGLPESSLCAESEAMYKMGLFGRKKESVTRISYDPETAFPAVRCSICTGERVAGLKKREDGSFEELMLIREPKDLEDFRTALGLADSAEITEFY